MATSDTVMIRVSKATRARLQAEIERLREAADAGQADDGLTSQNNNRHHLGITMDALINRLLDQREKKKQRRNAAARRRRQRE